MVWYMNRRLFVCMRHQRSVFLCGPYAGAIMIPSKRWRRRNESSCKRLGRSRRSDSGEWLKMAVEGGKVLYVCIYVYMCLRGCVSECTLISVCVCYTSVYYAVLSGAV